MSDDACREVKVTCGRKCEFYNSGSVSTTSYYVRKEGGEWFTCEKKSAGGHECKPKGKEINLGCQACQYKQELQYLQERRLQEKEKLTAEAEKGMKAPETEQKGHAEKVAEYQLKMEEIERRMDRTESSFHELFSQQKRDKA